MKLKESYHFVGYMGLGLFCGFFGSLLGYVEWIIAPVVGFVFFHALKQTMGVSERIIITAISLGIFLGGLPIWGLVLTSFEPNIWMRLVEILISLVLFLLGYCSASIFNWVGQWFTDASAKNNWRGRLK